MNTSTSKIKWINPCDTCACCDEITGECEIRSPEDGPFEMDSIIEGGQIVGATCPAHKPNTNAVKYRVQMLDELSELLSNVRPFSLTVAQMDELAKARTILRQTVIDQEAELGACDAVALENTNGMKVGDVVNVRRLSGLACGYEKVRVVGIYSDSRFWAQNASITEYDENAVAGYSVADVVLGAREVRS